MYKIGLYRPGISEDEIADILGVVDKPIDVGIILSMDSKNYVVCMLSERQKVIAVEEIRLNENPNETYGGIFTCPYCSYQYHDAFELSEDSGTVECPSCNSELEYEREVVIEYRVSPIKMNTKMVL